MYNRNLVILNGRATSDVELKNAKSSKVATIRLAVNELIKRNDGDDIKKTMYIDCECWGGRAEFASKNIKKGTAVSVVGKLELDVWPGQDGKERQKHKIYVRDVQIDWPPKTQDGNQQSAKPQENTQQTVSTSGLPF